MPRKGEDARPGPMVRGDAVCGCWAGAIRQSGSKFRNGPRFIYAVVAELQNRGLKGI